MQQFQTLFTPLLFFRCARKLVSQAFIRTNDEIDIKPYSLLIPPPPAGSRAPSAGRSRSSGEFQSNQDILRAYKRVTDGFRGGGSSMSSHRGTLPFVESSDRVHHDHTARIIGILQVKCNLCEKSLFEYKALGFSPSALICAESAHAALKCAIPTSIALVFPQTSRR